MNTKVEAVIIGGGVMGCSVLYQLAQKGMTNVILVEQDVLGSGSTGRSQAILRMHYSNPITSTMAWESLKIFRNFEDEVGYPSGYVKTGYCVIVDQQDVEHLDDNLTMQRNLGIETNRISLQDLKEIAPMLEVKAEEGIAYEPQSGYADPYMVATGYAKRAKEMGAKIYLHTKVSNINVKGGRIKSVTTTEGSTIETPIVLVAAGPWSRKLTWRIDIDLPLETIRHQVIMVRRPQNLIPFHPSVGDIAQEFSFRPDSSNLTLMGIGEDPVDMDTYNHGVDVRVVEQATVKLTNRIPLMAEAYFDGGWSGLFTTTPDWHPILDCSENIDGLYYGVGFSGHGFKLSPMVGICLSELITTGASASLDITPFRIGRFREGAVLKSRYRYNVLA